MGSSLRAWQKIPGDRLEMPIVQPRARMKGCWLEPLQAHSLLFGRRLAAFAASVRNCTAFSAPVGSSSCRK